MYVYRTVIELDVGCSLIHLAPSRLDSQGQGLVVGLFPELECKCFITNRNDIVSAGSSVTAIGDQNVCNPTTRLGEQTINQSAHPSYLYSTTLTRSGYLRKRAVRIVVHYFFPERLTRDIKTGSFRKASVVVFEA
ncbi:hypothetical protein T265_00727 [Opisthorchis viverrini]|uniref:Uncharacterized protein n=1 Tax=Opisthorchis viverrini TaxID=6198 RepID=A0A075AC13_OPIVI|nr:hypothetical protein T265_00727 [Opisthorchis viverrini]KER33415.1 hypothetical protein T265_00727 [Opisthorchis viverrini]